MFVDDFSFDGLGGLVVHDAARHIDEGKDDKHDAEDLENKVWNDDFTEDTERATGDADNRKNKSVFVVRIPRFGFEGVLETEDAFDEEEDADDDGNHFFNEAVLNDEEATGNAEGNSRDEFRHFLHVAVFNAKIGDEVISGKYDKGCADDDRNKARNFVGPNKKRNTKREQNNVHIDRHREFAHLLGGFDLDFANCFIGHVVSL